MVLGKHVSMCTHNIYTIWTICNILWKSSFHSNEKERPNSKKLTQRGFTIAALSVKWNLFYVPANVYTTDANPDLGKT
jgi:hypothetical protein